MAYIAFFDMLGTRSSASMGEKEYEYAIYDFHKAIQEVNNGIINSEIYAYSDNAYVQIETLNDAISFFRRLRKRLLFKHRYFSAALDEGTLNAKLSNFGKSSSSMIFTSPETIKVYLAQSRFSGIGITLSETVINNLKNLDDLERSFCFSIFQPKPEQNVIEQFDNLFDIAYDPVGLDELRYVIADYVTTSVMNKRAGRYYITPIISMIKCLDKNTIMEDLENLVLLITFQSLPFAFKSEGTDKSYPILFVFSLIEAVLTVGENDLSVDSTDICEQIIRRCRITSEVMIGKLSAMPVGVISNTHKRKFMQILFSMERDKQGSDF